MALIIRFKLLVVSFFVLMSIGLSACGGGGSAVSQGAQQGVSSPSPSPSPGPAPVPDPTQPPASSPTTPVWTATILERQLPVAHATVNFYQVLGNNQPQLLATTSSDANGKAALTTFRTPPVVGALVYVTAQGGQISNIEGNETHLQWFALIGTYCIPSSMQCRFPVTVTVNEFSTVVSAYALAAFLVDQPVVSLTGNALGLASAAATVASLVDPISANPSGSISNLSCTDPLQNARPNCTPLEKLNTLANSLGRCVSASVWLSGDCPMAGAIHTAADSLDLILQLVKTPAYRNDAADTFGSPAATDTFTPALSNAPADWSVALDISVGSLVSSRGLVVDGTGAIWIASSQNGTLTKIATDGQVLSPVKGFGAADLVGPQGIAIDARGRVWVSSWAQGSGNKVFVFNSDGTQAIGSPLVSETVNKVDTLSGPIAVAADSTGCMWVANYSNASFVSYGSPNGCMGDGAIQRLTGPFTGGGVAFPVDLEFDDQDHLWLLGSSESVLSEFTVTGSPTALSTVVGYTHHSLNQPSSLAIDPMQNVWISNQVANTLLKIVGGSTPPTQCSQPPLSTDTECVALTIDQSTLHMFGPQAIALDGQGSIFIANTLGGSLLAVTSGGQSQSTTAGYTMPTMALPNAVAIDSAGNVWVGNSGSNSVLKFLSLAAPVQTPKRGSVKPL